MTPPRTNLRKSIKNSAETQAAPPPGGSITHIFAFIVHLLLVLLLLYVFLKMYYLFFMFLKLI